MITYTKLLSVLLLVAFGAWSVRKMPPPDKRDLHCYLFVNKFPIYDKQGDKLPNDFFEYTNRVFVYHDLTMFEIAYGYQSGSVNNSPPTVSETRHQYFVFHKDSASGLEYDPSYPDSVVHRDMAGVRRLIGGFIDTVGQTSMFKPGLVPLLYARRDEAAGSLLEVYKIDDPKHPEDGDSLWLWYSDRFAMLPANLLHIHDKDSLSRMRLVQVKLQAHFHDIPMPPGSAYGPPDHGQILWKVEETPFFNRDSAAMYFAKYLTYIDSMPVRHNTE